MTNEGSFERYFYPPNATPKAGSLHSFFKHVPGGLEGMLNFLASAAATDEALADVQALVASALRFKRENWDLYESRILYWERLCETVGMTPLEFRTALIKEIDLYSSHLSHMQAISGQPELVRTSVELGRLMTPDTSKEREMIYKHNKFLPVPQTTITANSTVQNIQSVSNNLSLSSLPSFERMAQESVEAIGENAPLALPEGEVDYIDQVDLIEENKVPIER